MEEDLKELLAANAWNQLYGVKKREKDKKKRVFVSLKLFF